MNVAAGAMWIASALGGVGAMALPGTPHKHVILLIGLAAGSLVWGGMLLSMRFPRPGTPLVARATLTAVLIAVVGVALWATGGADSALQPIALFVVLHVAYFFPPRMAWPLLVLLIAAYAAPLLYDGRAVAAAYPARTLLFAVTAVATYAIMRMLKRRLVNAERRQRTIAGLDPLTGLANRRAFDSALERTVDRRAADGGDAALLLIDFDDFKEINDTHGHPVGDEVLRAVADVSAEIVRRGDCLARIGGDEFAIVAPDAGEPGARRLADTLERAIADAEMPTGVGAVAVTIAWAAVPDDATAAEQLFRVADRRLMERKRARKAESPAVVGGSAASAR
ncbi:MAG TPA: GGDEF domain-containing protein [Conexibacter sp.]|jgi:diguanylate cyclase (GGDEF)-like protein